MRRAALLALHAACLSVGLYYAFAPTIDSNFRQLQTDPGDTVLNHYLLEHSWKVASDSGYRFSLLSPPFFFPQPRVLGYSESLLGVAPIYWLIRCFAEPVAAFSLWMMAVSALNYCSFAVVARWLKWPLLESLLGAWLWAFGVVHLSQAGHQQLIPRFLMPFAIWCAIRFVRDPQPEYLKRGLVFIALQAICCVNSGVFLGYGVLIFTIVAITLRRGGWQSLKARIRGTPRDYIVAAVTGLGFCLLALVPNIIGNLSSGYVRGYENTLQFMPKPTAWLAPPPDWRWNYELGSLRDANCDECYLFGGAGMLALFCCCFLPIFLRRGAAKKLSASFGISALVAAAMVTDFGDGISPWYFARFLPGGMTIRAVGRVYIVVYLFILLGGISGLRMVLRQYVKKTSIRFFLMTLAGALIVFEQTGFTPPSFEAAKFYDRIGPVAERLLGADAGFVETSEFAGLQGKIRWDIQGHLLPMWAGLQANVPVVNGYSGRYPVEYPYRQWWSEDDFRRWLGPDFRGRLVIVNPDSLTVRELHLP